ncbi:hypothetical protein ACO2RV_19795 [Ancylobacter sp. VNQ12]|uniref:hypothetical protein n=1 Tax=Ancylobacter sp. VNQ12 TaxID=3400920 RepID=UPI003C10E04E
MSRAIHATALLAVVPLLMPAASPVAAQAALPLPGASAPRFTLQPVEGGVLKLDTRTGALSFCSTRAGGSAGSWVCEAVPEDRTALEEEITRLQGRIAELEKGRSGVPDIIAPPLPPTGRDAPPPPAEGEPAPPGAGESAQEAERKLDRAMDMAEHVFRRFFDMVNRLRSEPAPQEQKL